MQKGLPVYWKPLSLWNRGYLACALAMEALKQYITVKYVRMADFLLECTVAWDEKRYDKVLQAYARPKLFIIDEWLDIELTKNDLHAIKELVHRRRRKSSTIFCSQILKERWYQALGGENTEAEAIIDRITYDGYDINIEYTDPANAVSMRKIYSNLKPVSIIFETVSARKFAVRKIREKEKNKKIHIVIAFSISAQGDFSCYREMTC